MTKITIPAAWREDLDAMARGDWTGFINISGMTREELYAYFFGKSAAEADRGEGVELTGMTLEERKTALYPSISMDDHTAEEALAKLVEAEKRR